MRGHHVALTYHTGLLSDPVRVDAYDRALRALIKPGDVVLDVGTGSGILAMLAARHGAARVHAVESGEVADVAEALVRANHLADRVTVHRADLVDMPPVEPVDLILGDWLGRFVVDDQMLDAVAAARAWARPDTRWCPGEVDLHLGLLASPVPNLTRWSIPLRGLDLTPALPLARSQPGVVQARPEVLVAPPTRVHTLTPGDLALPALQSLILVTQPSAIFAVLGWFAAHLAPGVTLDSGPGHPTHWGQIAWPVPPTPVQPGDVVRAGVQVDGLHWSWSLHIERRGQVVLDHHARSDAGAESLGAPAPTSPAAEAAELGRQALQQGDLNAAVAQLGAAVRGAQPQDLPELSALLGTALAHAGLFTEAADALMHALSAGPRADALALLVSVTARLGQAPEAERWRREHLRHIGPWTDPLG